MNLNKLHVCLLAGSYALGMAGGVFGITTFAMAASGFFKGEKGADGKDYYPTEWCESEYPDNGFKVDYKLRYLDKGVVERRYKWHIDTSGYNNISYSNLFIASIEDEENDCFWRKIKTKLINATIEFNSFYSVDRSNLSTYPDISTLKHALTRNSELRITGTGQHITRAQFRDLVPTEKVLTSWFTDWVKQKFTGAENNTLYSVSDVQWAIIEER